MAGGALGAVASAACGRHHRAAPESLWRALAALPRLECLELVRCVFPRGTASPARLVGGGSGGLAALRSLCLYRCAGLTADVLADLVALCPSLDTLELHHGCPWRRHHHHRVSREGQHDDEDDDARDAGVHSSSSDTDDQGLDDDEDDDDESRREDSDSDDGHSATSRTRDSMDDSDEHDDEDDSVAAWIAGVAMATTRVRTLRLGDGVDDAALEWVAQLGGLGGLNVMHTYACDRLGASLAAALAGRTTLVALSLHVDGATQSCDDVARVIAASPAAASLRVLMLGDHVPAHSQADLAADPNPSVGTHVGAVAGAAVAHRDTLTDAGLAALARSCRALTRLMIDDAGRITVLGAATLIQLTHSLDQLVLRRCFAPNFAGARALYDVAARRRVQVYWEPRPDQLGHLKQQGAGTAGGRAASSSGAS